MNVKEHIVGLGASYLEGRGVENAKQEAIWLFEHVFDELELSRTPKTQEEELEQIAKFAGVKNTKRYHALLERRAHGEPLQYLLGEWEFYGYPMKVGKGVLIPRPETEFLVELGLDYIKSVDTEKPLVLDLCAGSGCVGVALAKASYNKVRVVAIELSEKAFEYAQENIRLNNVKNSVRVFNGDIFDEQLIEKFPEADCIFANPPYLSASDMRSLQKEVRHEPKQALYGGDDGLDFYRKIFKAWAKKLKSGGLFAVEVGDGQSEAVFELMECQGLNPAIMKDYSGVERIVYTKYEYTKTTELEIERLLKKKEQLLSK
ncbi:MAG: peptide chain release factor N(5)-glutamine methyltransferase [Oscillospiraceae bacterium]|nr:peptide chain release factor N(5)-glutamine methyltransferase [Oscillospiraceae bacterium]